MSFSYNQFIGDIGTGIILTNLPKTIREIVLKIKALTRLKILCIDQNIFSNLIKKEFKAFSTMNPQVLVVI